MDQLEQFTRQVTHHTKKLLKKAASLVPSLPSSTTEPFLLELWTVSSGAALVRKTAAFDSEVLSTLDKHTVLFVDETDNATLAHLVSPVVGWTNISSCNSSLERLPAPAKLTLEINDDYLIKISPPKGYLTAETFSILQLVFFCVLAFLVGARFGFGSNRARRIAEHNNPSPALNPHANPGADQTSEVEREEDETAEDPNPGPQTFRDFAFTVSQFEDYNVLTRAWHADVIEPFSIAIHDVVNFWGARTIGQLSEFGKVFGVVITVLDVVEGEGNPKPEPYGLEEISAALTLPSSGILYRFQGAVPFVAPLNGRCVWEACIDVPNASNASVVLLSIVTYEDPDTNVWAQAVVPVSQLSLQTQSPIGLQLSRPVIPLMPNPDIQRPTIYTPGPRVWVSDSAIKPTLCITASSFLAAAVNTDPSLVVVNAEPSAAGAANIPPSVVLKGELVEYTLARNENGEWIFNPAWLTCLGNHLYIFETNSTGDLPLNLTNTQSPKHHVIHNSNALGLFMFQLTQPADSSPVLSPTTAKKKMKDGYELSNKAGFFTWKKPKQDLKAPGATASLSTGSFQYCIELQHTNPLGSQENGVPTSHVVLRMKSLEQYQRLVGAISSWGRFTTNFGSDLPTSLQSPLLRFMNNGAEPKPVVGLFTAAVFPKPVPSGEAKQM